MLARRQTPIESPVLVVDALGFSEQIREAGHDQLTELAQRLDKQFHRFRAKVPHRLVWVGNKTVWGTGEYATLRLNDMFILHAGKPMDEAAIRFMLCGSILFHSMLLAGLVPRGGLGTGSIYRSKDLLVGSGFLDAYEAAEKRDSQSKDICAVQVSNSFLRRMPNTKRAWQLLCLYEGRFYIHPWFLTDPEMGTFSPDRILTLLKAAGTNQTKLLATEHFLQGFEDYEAAMRPGSITRRLLDEVGAPWNPTSRPES